MWLILGNANKVNTLDAVIIWGDLLASTIPTTLRYRVPDMLQFYVQLICNFLRRVDSWHCAAHEYPAELRRMHADPNRQSRYTIRLALDANVPVLIACHINSPFGSDL
jgi:hypothetical protein